MYFESKVGKVYYEVHGRDDAPAIIFSHGINMNHETFKAQAEALQEQYRVILWDLPYHSNSDPIDDNLPFTETAADVISDLLDHLSIKKAVLAGLSLGSYVTQIAAYKYPEKTLATVHIGGSPLHPPITPLVRIFNPLLGLFLRIFPNKYFFKTFANHRALKPETKTYLERVARENGKRVMIHLTQELFRDMSRGLPRHTTEPKLFCHGDQEVAFVQKQMARWHRECPESEMHIIKDAHHIANQDNPEETNRLLLLFLDRILSDRKINKLKQTAL